MGPLFCTFLILLFSFGTYVFVLHAVLGLGLVSLVSVDFALRAVSFPLRLLVSPPACFACRLHGFFYPIWERQADLSSFFPVVFQFRICKPFSLWVSSSLPRFPQQEKNVHGPPVREAVLAKVWTESVLLLPCGGGRLPISTHIVYQVNFSPSSFFWFILHTFRVLK